MLPNLTEIEQKILDYMVSYLRSNTYQPSIREIGERFGIKSTKTVSEHLQALGGQRLSGAGSLPLPGREDPGDGSERPGRFRPVLRPPSGGRKGPARRCGPEMFLTLDRRLAGEKGAFFVQARAEELAPSGCVEGDYILLEPPAWSNCRRRPSSRPRWRGRRHSTDSPGMARRSSSILSGGRGDHGNGRIPAP